MEIAFLLSGIAAGAVIGWLAARMSAQKNLNALQTSKAIAEQQSNDAYAQLQQLKSQLENSLSDVMKFSAEIASSKKENENLNQQLATQKQELEKLNEKLKTEFENMANKILEEKSAKFTEQNRTNLDIILNPLKERIQDFEKKVDATYKSEAAERNTLKGEIPNKWLA